MITLEGDNLVFRFPEVHEHAKTEIQFQRTLRIPDDSKHYPLPPGLGSFPLRHLDDFAARVPKDWRQRGGVMMPLYQAEAMWISFCGLRWSEGYPCAIKIAAGKINAVSGKRWKTELDGSDRDYVVVPEQPWLDGFCVAKDSVRQFVAMPLGSGYSVEEQITGKPEHGGLQIIVYPMKKERYEAIRREREEARKREGVRLYCLASAPGPRAAAMPDAAMGLAAGGRMTQQIYDDPYGLDAWDQSVSSRCFVTLVDAVQWCEITGASPPTKPVTASDYTEAGLPWFDYYAADLGTLAGAAELTAVKSVTEMAQEKGDDPLGAQEAVDPKLVIKLGPKPIGQPRPVREAHT
jgi:hypothetical protein